MKIKINPEQTEWTREERDAAVLLFRKINRCYRSRERCLPTRVLEAYVGGRAKPATNVVMFDDDGGVYLVFANGMWQVPGVARKPRESLAQSFERLSAKFGLTFTPPVGKGTHDVFYRPGGLCVSQVFSALAKAPPTQSNGKFFSPATIPWSDLPPGERNVVLPAAGIRQHPLKALDAAA